MTLAGNLSFEVPDGHRLLVTAGPAGVLHMQLQPLAAPTWEWRYALAPSGEVQLELAELGGGGGGGGSTSAGGGGGSTSTAAEASTSTAAPSTNAAPSA